LISAGLTSSVLKTENGVEKIERKRGSVVRTTHVFGKAGSDIMSVGMETSSSEIRSSSQVNPKIEKKNVRTKV